MNERIKAIGRQAGFAFIEDGIYGQRWYSSKCGMDASEFEKFAELIVFECVKAVMDGTKEGDHYAQRIEQHFDNGTGGVLHFGVENEQA